jgi:aminoglycoside phosphotransferase (APT) family kinase protein
MSDPAQVRTMLATMLAEAGDDGGYDVATIRYRPGERHVLRYDPVSPESATVFAKMSRGHDVGVEHRVAERAAAWVEDLHAGVHAARPLAHLEREEVLLYPRAAGEPLSALFLREGAAVDDHLRRTGAALRAMHDAATGPELDLEDHDFGAELKSITRAGEHVARLLPDASVILADVVERAAPLYAALPAEPATFVHGDFKADHLLIEGDDLTVLDFGTCKSGDPALDLGKFAADLHFWYSLSGADDVAEARGAFFEGYGDAPPGRLLRAGVYESLILLKSTVRRVPLFEPQWADRTAALIRRADQLLSVAEVARTTAS